MHSEAKQYNAKCPIQSNAEQSQATRCNTKELKATQTTTQNNMQCKAMQSKAKHKQSNKQQSNTQTSNAKHYTSEHSNGKQSNAK
jgi:hypothetical protein